MDINLKDLKTAKKKEFLEIIKNYEEIKEMIGCSQGELRNNNIDCFNCTECLKYAINKSIKQDINTVSNKKFKWNLAEMANMKVNEVINNNLDASKNAEKEYIYLNIMNRD